MSEEKEDWPALNTDTELWREDPEDYYASSIHVTKQNDIGIDVGGHVFVAPLSEWHKAMARQIDSETQENLISWEVSSTKKFIDAAKPFIKAFEEYSKDSYDRNKDDASMNDFLDGNRITPPMTVGDFRRLYEAYINFLEENINNGS